MPSTYNGIGTHYYGKRDSSQRVGTCRNCGHQGTLTSYETRLYVVVLFIPVIPLQRKRIIDDCPNCRCHFAAGADDFAMASQLGVSEAKENFRDDPSVENALQAHAQLLGLHQHEEAATLRAEAIERHPEDASLRAALADHLYQVSNVEEAQRLFQEAYELRPDLPEARVGIAFQKMIEGELEDARELLDFLLQPGAGQVYSLRPLETLASLYQSRREYLNALEIHRHLLAEFPEAAQNHLVRKQVRQLEKLLRQSESLLPNREGSWIGVFNPWNRRFSPGQRTLAFIGQVLLLVSLGLAAQNDHIRQNRTLHIVSGLGQPVTVQVDDLPPIQVHARETVTIPEGRHRIVVSGPVSLTQEIALHSGFFDRFFKSPVWVVNLFGSAALVQTDYYYAENPRPSTETNYAGKRFVALPHVDYPFQVPPDEIQVAGKQQLHKVCLGVQPPNPMSTILAIENPGEALQTAEAIITCHPEDALLLETYTQVVIRYTATQRGEQFLRTRLDRRPVEVAWHRAFQILLDNDGRADDLEAFYDAAFESEPNDGRLAYLRARIEMDPQKAAELFKRAQANAPDSPWPWYADAFASMCRGNWPQVRTDLEEALERGLEPLYAERLLFLSRLATGESDEIVKECLAELEANPFALQTSFKLLEARACLGEYEVARRDWEDWKDGAAQYLEIPQAAEAVDLLEAAVLYQLADFDSLGHLLGRLDNKQRTSFQFEMLLAQGHSDAIVADASLMRLVESDREAWEGLKLAVALHESQDASAAAEWSARSREKLAVGDRFSRRAARFLSLPSAPEPDELEQLELPLNQKLVLLCVLAQRYPGIKSDLQPLVRRLNISRMPPYHLVERVFGNRPHDPAGI